jgi:hypothetical protein
MEGLLKASMTVLIAVICIMSVGAMSFRVSFANDAGAGKQRFIDNGNGTVSDRTNGLVWQQTDDSQTRKWADAIAYCQNLTLADKKDWRLPTRQELKSIVDDTRSQPAINTTYFRINGMRYWSLSTYDDNPDLACFVFFKNGSMTCCDKINAFLVRCVRNGQ